MRVTVVSSEPDKTVIDVQRGDAKWTRKAYVQGAIQAEGLEHTQTQSLRVKVMGDINRNYQFVEFDI